VEHPLWNTRRKEEIRLADTHAQPTETQQVAPETQKRGRGRPPKAPEEPRPPQENAVEFFDWLKTFPEVDWKERLIMYLFRRFPMTDRKLTGNDTHLMKYVKPVDAQEILENFGSGEYRLQLNQWDSVTRKTTTIANFIWRMVNMDYPPKIPLGEWLDDPKNKEWAWAKPRLQAQLDAEIKAAGMQPAGAVGEAASMFKAAVDAVKQLRPDKSPEEQTSLAHMIIQTLEKTLDKNSSSQAGMLDVVDKIISAVKPSGEGSASIITLVTGQLTAIQTELAAERAFNRDLLQKLSEPKTQSSLKDQLLEMKDIFSLIRGGGAAKAGGLDWAEVVRDVGTEVIKTVQTGFQAYMVKKASEQGKRVTVDRKSSDSPGRSRAITATNPEQEQMDMLEAINNQFGPMFDDIAPFLVDHFRKGFSGMVFREWFREENGEKLYRMVRGFSPETITGIIEIRKRVAEPRIQSMLQELQPTDAVVQFVQEFLSDAPIEEDEPETPDDSAQGKVASEF